MSVKSKSIVIVTHKFVTHPDDALVEYLNTQKCDDVLHICHSFYEAPDRKSYYTWYKNGEVSEKKETYDYSFLPEPLIYVKELYFSIVWVLFTKIKWETYIGMDGLCVLAGNILKQITSIKKTVYWAIDFVPQNRFSQEWKNKIYHLVNISGYKNSDEMWDLSPRMAKARKEKLGISKSDYKKIIVVPYGMYPKSIQKYSYQESQKNTIVFMGHIKESQGVQLVIKALPQLISLNTKISFKIIGTGPFVENLKRLANDLHVIKHCHFLGKIEDHTEVEDEIAKSAVAVAPYIKKLDKWTYYADPGKVKTYLGCGVPVLLTDLPWNAREIVKNKCGVIITEDIEDIVKNIQILLKKDTNVQFRKNSVVYSQKFNYENIFESLHI